MKQSSLRDLHMKKQLRVVAFLKEMEDAIPWHEILNALKPYYKTGEGGRPPHPLERMLRIHFLQLWYNPATLPLKKPSMTALASNNS